MRTLSAPVLTTVFLLLLAVTATAQSVTVTPIDRPPPEGISHYEYTPPGASGPLRVYWGAVVCIIDEWDTQAYGTNHTDLIWYRYSYYYPDNSLYSRGYNWTDRADPDPAVRPGTWFCGNWPISDPAYLYPITDQRELRAVSRGEAYDQGYGDHWQGNYYATSSTYSRWYPHEPAVVTDCYTYDPYYHPHVQVSYGYSGPYVSSTVFLGGMYLFGSIAVYHAQWSYHAYEMAQKQAEISNLYAQFNAATSSRGRVQYLDELSTGLRDMERRYPGSMVERYSTDLKTGADVVFGSRDGEEHAAVPTSHRRLPEGYFNRFPVPELAQAPGEYLQRVAARMRPQVGDASLGMGLVFAVQGGAGAGETVSLFASQNDFTGGALGGMFAGSQAVQRAVFDVSGGALSAIDAATQAMDERTGFAQTVAGIQVLSAGDPALGQATFVLTSGDAGLGGAVAVGYSSRSEGVDFGGLLPEADRRFETVSAAALFGGGDNGAAPGALRLGDVRFEALSSRFSRRLGGELAAPELLSERSSVEWSTSLRGRLAALWESYRESEPEPQK